MDCHLTVFGSSSNQKLCKFHWFSPIKRTRLTKRVLICIHYCTIIVNMLIKRHKIWSTGQQTKDLDDHRRRTRDGLVKLRVATLLLHSVVDYFTSLFTFRISAPHHTLPCDLFINYFYGQINRRFRVVSLFYRWPSSTPLVASHHCTGRCFCCSRSWQIYSVDNKK